MTKFEQIKAMDVDEMAKELDNDTHRFKCCPNCGRWFGKGKRGQR